MFDGNFLVAILVPIALCVVLPVMIVWIVSKARAHEVNKRTEVLLAAIEKNSDVDVDKFFQKMSPENLTIKEKLLAKLQKGVAMTGIGGGGAILFITLMCLGGDRDICTILLIVSGVLLAVGVGFLFNYKVGKKMLASEMETELENMKLAEKNNTERVYSVD